MSFRFRVLGSGSSGNATLVEAGGTRILLDAGLGPRDLAERLESAGVDPASIETIFITHEHGDHARGAASFSRRWDVRLSGTRGTYAAAGFGACKLAGYDPVETSREIGPLRVTAVPVPHDAAEPVAFVVSYGELSFGHATDLGHLSRNVVQAFSGCQAVLVEANYDPAMLRDGPYPWSLKERILSPLGHLSNGDVARYFATALPVDCGVVVLAHLSQKNNHPELARMAAEAGLAQAGRGEVEIRMTSPEGTGWIDVGAPARPTARAQMRLF